MIDEDVYVDDFLEHFGKKGMRWGSRRVRRHGVNSTFGQRTQNRLTVGVGGTAGLLVARQAGQLIANKFNIRLNKALVMGAGATAGVALTRKFLIDKGDVPMSSLSKSK